MAAKKIYTIRYSKSNMTKDVVRYMSGTLERLNDYYGKSCRTITSLIKQVNKDYSWQYACCYTVAGIENVETVPEGVEVRQLDC